MKLFKNINFDKLKSGLSKTRHKIVTSLNETITGKVSLDDVTLDELEEILITSDMGYETSMDIIDEVREEMVYEKERGKEQLIDVVKRVLQKSLTFKNIENEYQPETEQYKPFVMLIIGVNGSGKTTTIGKLAHNFKQSGLDVMVGAADTFRAAANDQLEIWAERAGVPIIQKGLGGDPSSVAYETIDKAIQSKTDVVMIDTAGRLHTKMHLMDELAKINRVIKKKLDYAPNETFLVIDGNTGQNALTQVEQFSKVCNITGLIITKLDGTAKGGIIFQIVNKLKIPVRYIGVGEGMQDLQTFDPEMFVSALFEQ